jgi:hypothetical protein
MKMNAKANVTREDPGERKEGSRKRREKRERKKGPVECSFLGFAGYLISHGKWRLER